MEYAKKYGILINQRYFDPSDPYITEFNSAKELIKQMQHDEEIITSEIKRICNHTYSQNEIEKLLIERGYAPEDFKSIIGLDIVNPWEH